MQELMAIMDQENLERGKSACLATNIYVYGHRYMHANRMEYRHMCVFHVHA